MILKLRQYIKPLSSVITIEPECTLLAGSGNTPTAHDRVFNMGILTEIKSESADNAMSKGADTTGSLWEDEEEEYDY